MATKKERTTKHLKMEILNETFFRYALISGTIIAALCSCLGIYIILRRIVFIGLALSQIAALGAALGLFFGWSTDAVALAATFIGSMFFWKPYRNPSLTDESLIGFVYAIAAAVGVILLTKNPAIEAGGIDLVGGNILYTTSADIRTLVILAIIVFAVYGAFARKFLFVSFDKETAHTVGMKTGFYEFLLYLSIGTAIALSIRIGGILFVFSSLIVPPMAGLSLFRNFRLIFISSVVFAVVSVLAGTFLSYFLDLPTSPTILCLYGVLFIGVNLLKFLLKLP